MSKGLGKGLADLFGDETRDKIENNEETATQGFSKIPLTQIEPNINQPRKIFDENALKELSDSIKIHGILSPIAVRKVGNYYQIIAGERRWRAARMAGITEVPAMIVEVDDKTVIELALIENLQREDLNPIEMAKGYKMLMDEFGLTQELAAERLSKSRPSIANALRLLVLSEEIIVLIEKGALSSGHARAILAVNDSDKHLPFANTIINSSLSVRQAEAMAKKLNKDEVKIDPEIEVKVDYAKELSNKIESILGRKVVINYGKSKGKIELEYYGDDDLERLCEALTQVKI